MKTLFALLWSSTTSQDKFDAAVPKLMTWLQELKTSNRLRACGGFANEDGGLTIIEVASLSEAKLIAIASPQAALGTTRIIEWEVYDADLRVQSGLEAHEPVNQCELTRADASDA